ncbi:glycoside hydrolase family 76 protein [Xylaria venustula]|nr:glycoside hydrolase family 76 protein [Xylaria venustula]
MRSATPLGLVLVALSGVTAISNSDADAMFNDWNTAFLSGSQYRKSVDDSSPDTTWPASLDILVAEDAFDRTGDASRMTLVNNLLNSWLTATPPPWSWDGWNDDIGWFTLALARGYQITGTQNFLTQAEYGFNYAFGRGWDETYVGGGIWEEQPANAQGDGHTPGKEALSNDSLGKVACLLFQSTGNQTYLQSAEKIYAWVRKNLFDTQTGKLITGIDWNNNAITGTAAYNQGTFIDFATLLWKTTFNSMYRDDALLALEFGKSSLTKNGIFSNSNTGLNTWADEMARGVGNIVTAAGKWDTYFDWMNQNANSILANRRTDKGITWNAWDQLTPNTDLKTNTYASAVAWLQYTPAVKPSNVSGIMYITNKATGLRIDSGSSRTSGSNIVQWGANTGLAQKWLINQSPDFSWTLTSLQTWLVVDNPAGSTQNGADMIQWRSTRATNQRWWIDQQADGSYKIWNKESEKALDGSGSTNNGALVAQNDWTGADSQKWVISRAG